MADSTSNTPQRAGWNSPNVGPVVEHATIGSSIVIKGEVSGSEALFVDGTVEGMIRIPDHRVTVGRDSKLKADIEARDVVVMGAVKGNIHCADLLDIRGESNIQGKIVTRRIRIDDGAVLRGSVEIHRPEKVVAPPQDAVVDNSKAPVTAEKKPERTERVPDVSPEIKMDPAAAKENAKEEVVASATAKRMGASAGWFNRGK